MATDQDPEPIPSSPAFGPFVSATTIGPHAADLHQPGSGLHSIGLVKLEQAVGSVAGPTDVDPTGTPGGQTTGGPGFSNLPTSTAQDSKRKGKEPMMLPHKKQCLELNEKEAGLLFQNTDPVMERHGLPAPGNPPGILPIHSSSISAPCPFTLSPPVR